MSEPIEPIDEKARVGALITLAQGAFLRRKEIEAVAWKMSFSIWGAIGTSTWALRNAPHPEHFGSWARLLWLVVPLHVLLISRFQASVRQAVTIALGYVAEAEKTIRYVPPKKQRSPDLFWWPLMSVGPTALLVGAAIKLLW